MTRDHFLVFAHIGLLRGIEVDPRFPTRRFLRVGDTDSEHAFCALLERIAPAWAGGVPSVDAHLPVLREGRVVHRHVIERSGENLIAIASLVAGRSRWQPTISSSASSLGIPTSLSRMVVRQRSVPGE